MGEKSVKKGGLGFRRQTGGRWAEMQAMLLSAVDELKTAAIGSEALLAAAGECGGSLGDKLEDLALVLESYNAVVANGHADPADRLTVLAGQIEKSDLGEDSHVYVDGFIDFTRQEQQVLLALLRKNAQLTICLTVDSMEGDNEIYALSRRAGRALLLAAEELGVETRVERLSSESGKNAALNIFTENMFSYSAAVYPDEGNAIQLYRCESMTAECELAAARALELVREQGCRWRDIAILARGFEDYRGCLESIFRHYGVPLYTAARSDLLSKPLAALMGAYLTFISPAGRWTMWSVICAPALPGWTAPPATSWRTIFSSGSCVPLPGSGTGNGGSIPMATAWNTTRRRRKS